MAGEKTFYPLLSVKMYLEQMHIKHVNTRIAVFRNESDEGDDPEKKKFQNQLSGKSYIFNSCY